MKRNGCLQDLSMEFKISTIAYWDKFYTLYKFNSYYKFNGKQTIIDRSDILAKFGLSFNHQNHMGQYCFTVVDQRMFLVARLKYAI